MRASGATWSRQRHLGGEPAQTIESKGHNRAHEWPRAALSPFSSICRQDLRLYFSTFNCRLLISVGPFSPPFSIFYFLPRNSGVLGCGSFDNPKSQLGSFPLELCNL
jgi:hypothetical protein